MRTIALAGRVEELAGVVESGRRAHLEWVEEMFAPQLGRRRSKLRERRLRLLAAVLDVTMWRQLRRDQGLDQAETREHLTMLVEGVLAR